MPAWCILGKSIAEIWILVAVKKRIVLSYRHPLADLILLHSPYFEGHVHDVTAGDNERPH